MTIRIVGLPSQPTFINTEPGSYINLSDVRRISASGANTNLFVSDGVGWPVNRPVTDVITALKTAGITIIEGLV